MGASVLAALPIITLLPPWPLWVRNNPQDAVVQQPAPNTTPPAGSYQ